MISIIIPTFNEEEQIEQTINKIKSSIGLIEVEILVVDGGSNDKTIIVAKQCGATIVKSLRKGRSAQMNSGALVAKHKILYFLHADSIPPNNFVSQILNAIDKGAKSGCFRLRFDYDHWFLKLNAWFTRFNVNAFRFGDQSLFVTKNVFQKAGGFREDLIMMEDQEIVHRLKLYGKFNVINDTVITSARKYIDNGVFRMQSIFYRIWGMYYLGYSQEKMLRKYKRLIRNHKL